MALNCLFLGLHRRSVRCLTFAVKCVWGRELHTHLFLQVMHHAHPSEGWGEVNLIRLALWSIWVVGHLITTCNVLDHS